MPPDHGPKTQADSARTLLLVEDSEDDARLALRALEQIDLQLNTYWVKDGDEALSSLGLDENSEPMGDFPDLVICDLQMPRVGGLEVLRRIRSSERLCKVPVVIFSSSTYFVEVDHCIQSGANDYCYKPFDAEEYANCVRDVVRRWLSASGSDVSPSCLIETEA